MHCVSLSLGLERGARARRQHHRKCSAALHSSPFNINHFTRASSQPAEGEATQARPACGAARMELKRLSMLSAFLLNLAGRQTDVAREGERRTHIFLLNWPDGRNPRNVTSIHFHSCNNRSKSSAHPRDMNNLVPRKQRRHVGVKIEEIERIVTVGSRFSRFCPATCLI